MNSWVYVIRSGSDNLYVGSTTNLQARRSAHKRLSRRSSKPLYACIRGNGGWDAIEFRILEMAADLSTHALRVMEQQYIHQLHPIFNRNRAYSELRGTPYHRQYRAMRGLDHFQRYNREYRTLNRDRINEQRRRARQQRRMERAEAEEAARVLQSLQDMC